MRLRPSAILKYEDCPRSYWYQYVCGVRPEALSGNLVFGTVFHSVAETIIRHSIAGTMREESVYADLFQAKWQEKTAGQIVSHASTWSVPDLLATGRRLSELFCEAWPEMGLTPLMLESGPLMEVRLEAYLGHGVYLTGQPDLGALDQHARLGPYDLKTPASLDRENFALQGDQLTAYQLLMDANRERLGGVPVERLGYIQAIKRKVGGKQGPTIQPIETVPARDIDCMREYRDKVLDYASDIKRGRFQKTPRMPHNTPCGMCDFRGHCERNDATGLVLPDTFAELAAHAA